VSSVRSIPIGCICLAAALIVACVAVMGPGSLADRGVATRSPVPADESSSGGGLPDASPRWHAPVGGSPAAAPDVEPALLRVTTNPPVPALISVDGISRNEWGLNWMKIEPGLHTVSFSDVPGYATPDPLSLDTFSGQATEAVGAYTRLGELRVITDPAVPGTISVNGIPRDDWGIWLSLPAGTYTASYGPVAGYARPPDETVAVIADRVVKVTGRYAFDGVSPGPDPDGYGLLRVASDPPAGTQILVEGIPRDEWGLDWVKLAPGTYEVSFTDVPRLGTPAPRSVDVVARETTSAEGRFEVLGSLRVTTGPPVPSTIFVDGVPRDDWGIWRAIPAGTYTVAFGDVPGYVAPPPRPVSVTAGQLTHVRGAFASTRFDQLDWPTAFSFSPDGRIFVAERLTGAIRIIRDGALQALPFAVLANTGTTGEQGLLGLALDPAFPQAPWVYAYHTFEDPTGGVYNRVVRIRAVGDLGGPPEALLAPIPASSFHNGGVIGFGPDGKLYVLTGDAQDSQAAQDLRVANGKVLRTNPDGTVPADNPFVGSPNANPYVFTLGHRNMFGIAFHPVTGRAYVTENGPQDSDEVNLLVAGGNYGWPIVRGIANDPRFIDPLVVYVQVIAPTNAIAYTGSEFPEFEGDLLFGDWNTGSLRRLDLVPPAYDAVAGQEVAFGAPSGILDVELAPDGSIWFTTFDAIYRWGAAAG